MNGSLSGRLFERFLVGWGSLILVVASLYWAKPILVPLILAMLLAFVLNPLVAALQHRGLGRVPTTILVVALITTLLGILGWGIISQLEAFANALPEHKDRIIAKISVLQESGHGRISQLLNLGKEIGEE